MKIIFLTKRWYMNKDLIDDKYGRYYQLPKYLSEKNIEIHLVCIDYHSKYYKDPELIRDGRLSVILHRTGSGLRIPGLLRYIYSVKKYIKTTRPDILIGASDAIQVIIAAYLANSFNIKLVLDLYDNYESYRLTKLPLIKHLFRKTIKTANGITVITPELEKYIRRLSPAGKIRVIGNAVNKSFNAPILKHEARHRLKLPMDGVLFGTAGELSANRGVDTLIKAACELISETDNYFLILAGKIESGLLPGSMKRIFYLGELDHDIIPVLFSALDVGVICNLDDEFGRYCHPQKACEMIACQLPFIAAKTGYLSRILKHTPELLFTPGNHHSLKDAIKYQAGRKYIPTIRINTWQQQADSLVSLLNKVILS